MSGYHAQLSPSSASRWTSCTASVGAQAGIPNTTSDASRPGTCGHQMGAEILEFDIDPQTYLGRTMGFPSDGREDWADKFPDGTVFEHTVTVDQELLDATMSYVRFVRNMRDTLGAQLIVERQVPIGHITGEKDARGTSDCILLAGETLITVDLKLGRGRVTAYDVIAQETDDTPPVLRMNLQLALYLLGSLEEYGLLGDFQRVKGVIVQPFLNHVSEYECSVEELLALGRWLSERAEVTRTNPEFAPSHKNCFFCKARRDCYARNALVLQNAVDGFEDVTTAKPRPVPMPSLGQMYGLVEMVRKWADDVEEKCFELVDAGEVVIGPDNKPLKLVEGRKPSKSWDFPEVVEKLLKDMRIKPDVMYVRRLITPTEADKLAMKPKGRGRKPAPEAVEAEADAENRPIGKVQWTKLEPHIVQGKGKPTLALGSDKRTALPTAAGLQDSNEPPADNSDLF